MTNSQTIRTELQTAEEKLRELLYSIPLSGNTPEVEELRTKLRSTIISLGATKQAANQLD